MRECRRRECAEELGEVEVSDIITSADMKSRCRTRGPDREDRPYAGKGCSARPLSILEIQELVWFGRGMMPLLAPAFVSSFSGPSRARALSVRVI